MPGGAGPDNRHDFPGGFPSESQPSAFTADTRTLDQQSAFAFASSLFATRKDHPALQGAPQQDLFADETAIAFLRTQDLNGCMPGHTHDAVLVAINKDANPRTLTLKLPDTALAGCTQFQPLAPANTGVASVSNTTLQLTLPGDSFVLFSVR
jgi:hypothetical protein